jgi:hypothetical protein
MLTGLFIRYRCRKPLARHTRYRNCRLTRVNSNCVGTFQPDLLGLTPPNRDNRLKCKDPAAENPRDEFTQFVQLGLSVNFQNHSG